MQERWARRHPHLPCSKTNLRLLLLQRLQPAGRGLLRASGRDGSVARRRRCLKGAHTLRPELHLAPILAERRLHKWCGAGMGCG